MANTKISVIEWLIKFMVILKKHPKFDPFDAAVTVHRSIHSHHNYDKPLVHVDDNYKLAMVIDYISHGYQRIGENIVSKEKISDFVKNWIDLKYIKGYPLLQNVLTLLEGKILCKNIYKRKTFKNEELIEFKKEYEDLLKNFKFSPEIIESEFEVLYIELAKIKEKYYDIWLNIDEDCKNHIFIYKSIYKILYGDDAECDHDYDKLYLPFQFALAYKNF